MGICLDGRRAAPSVGHGSDTRAIAVLARGRYLLGSLRDISCRTSTSDAFGLCDGRALAWPISRLAHEEQDDLDGNNASFPGDGLKTTPFSTGI